jgi:fumarate hydratase, class I
MAVSCSADRNLKAKITKDGLFIEQLDRDPGRLIARAVPMAKHEHGHKIDLSKPMLRPSRSCPA